MLLNNLFVIRYTCCVTNINILSLSLLIIWYNIHSHKMKRIFKQLILSLGFISLGLSQDIPNEFMQFQIQKLLTDAGQNWGTNTSFGLPRFQSISKTNIENSIKFDSLNI